MYLVTSAPTDCKSPVLAGFSVPKKKFPLSVDRHRVRRLMVESWRLSKHMLYPKLDPLQQIHVFFMFTDKQLPAYQTVHSAMQQCIAKLEGAVGSASNSSLNSQVDI